AAVGEPYDTHVGQELELEVGPAFLAGASEVGPARRAIGGAGEPGIAAPAARPARDEHALTRNRQVAQPLARGAGRHHGAEGHVQHGVVTGGARLVRALAMLAALSRVMPPVVEVEEGGDGRIGLEEDAATVAPVPAVRAAAWDELLAPEAHAPRAPVAALDEDVDLVDEHLRPRGGRARSGGLLGDADVLVVALALEANVAVGGGEQRVVRTEPDVDARLEAGAALAHDNAAG